MQCKFAEDGARDDDRVKTYKHEVHKSDSFSSLDLMIHKKREHERILGIRNNLRLFMLQVIEC